MFKYLWDLLKEFRRDVFPFTRDWLYFVWGNIVEDDDFDLSSERHFLNYSWSELFLQGYEQLISSFSDHELSSVYEESRKHNKAPWNFLVSDLLWLFRRWKN